jgi:hypothetical protein
MDPRQRAVSTAREPKRSKHTERGSKDSSEGEAGTEEQDEPPGDCGTNTPDG